MSSGCIINGFSLVSILSLLSVQANIINYFIIIFFYYLIKILFVLVCQCTFAAGEYMNKFMDSTRHGCLGLFVCIRHGKPDSEMVVNKG